MNITIIINLTWDPAVKRLGRGCQAALFRRTSPFARLDASFHKLTGKFYQA